MIATVFVLLHLVNIIRQYANSFEERKLTSKSVLKLFYFRANW